MPYASLYSCKCPSIHAYAEVRTRPEFRLFIVILLFEFPLLHSAHVLLNGHAKDQSLPCQCHLSSLAELDADRSEAHRSDEWPH